MTTTELATVDGEVIEQRAPLTLFGTDNPSEVVARATSVATALADVLKQRHLVKRIGNREYVLLEGWTLLGSMLGVFAQVEWTRPIEGGWEARAVVRTMPGAVVGSAEAMCSKSEKTWSSRDDYAVRSMAQTRALAKALRMPLGFIVELAGYAATPADEMPDGLPDIPEKRGPTREQIIARLLQRAEEHDLPAEVLRDVVDSAFEGRKFEQLTDEELIQLGTDITKGKYDLPTEPAADERHETEATVNPATTPLAGPTLEDLLAATGGTVIEQPVGEPAGSGGSNPPPIGAAAMPSGAAVSAPPSAPNPAREAAKKAEARAEQARLARAGRGG